jgi:hypothetical protein
VIAAVGMEVVGGGKRHRGGLWPSRHPMSSVDMLMRMDGLGSREIKRVRLEDDKSPREKPAPWATCSKTPRPTSCCKPSRMCTEGNPRFIQRSRSN